MKTVISTAELAQLLSVNESTVKRWADLGHIECIRTQGGHRRFSVPAVMKFIQGNKLTLPEIASTLFDRRELHAQLLSGNSEPLVDEIRMSALEGDVDSVLSILQIALAASPDLLNLYSEILLPTLARIGDEVDSRSILVDMERLATSAIRQALVRFQADIRRKDFNGLKAVCACFEGERSDIGLYCASSYLVSEGWHVFYLGEDIPTDALIGLIDRRRPDLVIVAARIIEDEWKFLNDVSEGILPAVRHVGARLVLEGPDLDERFGKKLDVDAIWSSILDFNIIGKSSWRKKEQPGRQ